MLAKDNIAFNSIKVYLAAIRQFHLREGQVQGTVLGPVMFLLYINDINNNVSSSLRLFADDCIIYYYYYYFPMLYNFNIRRLCTDISKKMIIFYN